MADLYEISLYNTAGIKQTVLQGWSRLEFTQRINAPWNHDITIPMSSKDPAANFLRNNVDVDWIIRIKRTDPITGTIANVYEGFNRTVVDQAKTAGDLIFNLYGSGYTELLSRRIVVPPSGQDVSAKTGVAETIAKQFVTEQAVSPTDATRKISGLSVQADLAQGKIASYSARYTNLLTVISQIAEQGDVDFGIVGGTAVGTFIFQLRPLWGTDHSKGNIFGNVPVIFDMNFGNMSIPILSKNRSEEINYVYVGGSGEGSSRSIFQLAGITVSDSPWNRREAFVSASQDAQIQALSTKGQAYLQNKLPRKNITFKILQTPGTRWLKDWVLGDIITAKYFEQVFLKQISQVTVAITSSDEAQREYVTVEMLDVPDAWLLNITGKTELGVTTILG